MVISVLSLGLSPTSAFIASRLSVDTDISVSTSWKSGQTATLVIRSQKAGQTTNQTSFVPAASYDPKTIGSESVPGLIDVLLFAPTSLKSLASFHRSPAASLVTPNHTIILVESTNLVNLHPMLEKRFPNNPVCAVSTDAPLRLSPNSSVLFHQSPQTATLFTALPPKFPQPIHSRYAKLLSTLQSAGVDAYIAQNYTAAQWMRVIPFLAFQPLTVLLEAPSSQNLISNVLSKPLYSGIVNELVQLASKHSGSEFPPNYLASLVDLFLSSSTNNTSISNNINNISSNSNQDPSYLDSPLLFYNYFHYIPLVPDLLLLQPILMADDLGIKTPYLESVFAFLSQMATYNSSSSVSVFLNRIKPEGQDVTTKQQHSSVPSLVPPPVSTVSTDSALSGSSNTLSSSSASSSASSAPAEADTISVKLQQLELREQALSEREQMLNARDQKLAQWSQNLRRQQQFQFQGNNGFNSNVGNGNPQVNGNNVNINNHNNTNMNMNNSNMNGNNRSRYTISGPPPGSVVPPNNQLRPRPLSAMQAPPMNGMSRIEPPVMEHPGNVDNLDMMSITSRKNRRSFCRNNSLQSVPSAAGITGTNGKPMRNSVSAVSLSSMNPSINGRTMSMNASSFNRTGGRMSVTEFTLNEGLASPNIDLDTFSSLTSNRYAAVDSAKLSKNQRSNSLTIDSLMGRNPGSMGQQQQQNQQQNQYHNQQQNQYQQPYNPPMGSDSISKQNILNLSTGLGNGPFDYIATHVNGGPRNGKTPSPPLGSRNDIGGPYASVSTPGSRRTSVGNNAQGYYDAAAATANAAALMNGVYISRRKSPRTSTQPNQAYQQSPGGNGYQQSQLQQPPSSNQQQHYQQPLNHQQSNTPQNTVASPPVAAES